MDETLRHKESLGEQATGTQDQVPHDVPAAVAPVVTEETEAKTFEEHYRREGNFPKLKPESVLTYFSMEEFPLRLP